MSESNSDEVVNVPETPEKNEAVENVEKNVTQTLDGMFDVTPEKSGGVRKQLLRIGEGEEHANIGDRVIFKYNLWLLAGTAKPVLLEGTSIGQTSELIVGGETVIKGWSLAFTTMKKKEAALFVIHPDYAYGAIGVPSKVPPHATLLFEIELLDWKLEDLSPLKDNGVLRKVIDKGEPSKYPNDGGYVKVYLIGYYKGKVFDEGEKEFILGEGCNANVPEGVEVALFKFNLKEKSIIFIKGEYGFENGSNIYNIPPNVDLKYEVTLLEFKRVQEVWEMNTDDKFKKAKESKDKALTFFKAGRYRPALRSFKWITYLLDREPGAPAAKNERFELLLSGYLNMTLCYLKMERYNDAINVCNRILQIDPKNEKALYRRGQAKMAINDCVEALADFKALHIFYPENKAAKQNIGLCREKIKKQDGKDKSVYNKMFETFVKQDEERLRNMKTETGVWAGNKQEKKESHMNHNQRLYEQHDAVLRDANIIELSNTACLNMNK